MNSHGKGSNPNAALYQALLKLKTPEECYSFFEDLCTMSEMIAMEQRFEVAQLLSAGHIYNDILDMTHASSATISRVKRSLQYGAGGYQMLIQRMQEDAPEDEA